MQRLGSVSLISQWFFYFPSSRHMTFRFLTCEDACLILKSSLIVTPLTGADFNITTSLKMALCADATDDPFVIMPSTSSKQLPSRYSTSPADQQEPSPSSLYNLLFPSAVQSRISGFRRRKAWSPFDNSPTRIKGTDLISLERPDDASLSSSSSGRISASRSRQPSPGRCPQMVAERKEGRYARHGINMLETLVLESELHADNSNGMRRQAFVRQHYIQSLACLCHGLPEDLSTQEVQALRVAMPEQVFLNPLHSDHDQALQRVQRPVGIHLAAPNQQQSLLHRLSAFLILMLFIVVQAVIPYLRYLLRAACRFEQEHHVSEQCFAQGLNFLGLIWRLAARAVRRMLKSSDGRLAGLVLGGLLWCSREMARGMNEGLGKGCELLGIDYTGREPVAFLT